MWLSSVIPIFTNSSVNIIARILSSDYTGDPAQYFSTLLNNRANSRGQIPFVSSSLRADGWRGNLVISLVSSEKGYRTSFAMTVDPFGSFSLCRFIELSCAPA
jgi:hypothetical protein